jgi:peptidylprolyl isomerase
MGIHSHTIRGSFVRTRPLVALSLAAASALLLAGCAGSADPDASGSPTASPAADLCDAAAPSGAASEAVTVEGDFNTQPTVTFDAPLDITSIERTVVTEGEGEPIVNGDFVTLSLTALDAQSGDVLGTLGYDTAMQPQQISSVSPLGQLVGCATPGTRVVATLPATDSSEAQVYVVDVVAATPESEWCTVQPFESDVPTVEFADDNPTITIPGVEAPDGVRVEVLKEGDGDEVGAGDTVEVNYEGVKWSDGTVFDSSYDRGEATSFSTDGVVIGFKRALEGQKVGSQVLVSMAPSCAYGEVGSSSSELAGETLVFVIDIIGTTPAEQ